MSSQKDVRKKIYKNINNCIAFLPVQIQMVLEDIDLSSFGNLRAFEFTKDSNQQNNIQLMQKALQRQQNLIKQLKKKQAVNKTDSIETMENQNNNQINVKQEEEIHYKQEKIQPEQFLTQKQIQQPMLLNQQNWHLQSEDSIIFFHS